jgi:hypothetical protein
MTPSSFTAVHKPTGRSVTVSGRQVLYSTQKQSWTHEASGEFEAARTALLWVAREAKQEEAA